MAFTDIDNPELYFQTKLYSGDGSTQSVTLDGDIDMQPDLVWLKCRSTAYHNRLFNSVSGAGKNLISDNTNAEQTVDEGVTAFNSDGFSVKQGSSLEYNASGQTYVAWNWKESATAGFDIVAYTGNGTAGATVSHSLSAVPNVMIIKRRNTTDSWGTYHSSNTSAPETDVLTLNTNNATADSNTRWNDTAPTSSVFTVGDDGGMNDNGSTYVAYLWSEKQGYSKFGSYTGNGNADGTFVYTGFKPAFVMVKRTDSTANWQILDNKRNTYNPWNTALFPDTTDPDTTDYSTDHLSNGFKLKVTTTSRNGSGATYIYMAFAEAPFVTSTGIPTTAR